MAPGVALFLFLACVLATPACFPGEENCSGDDCLPALTEDELDDCAVDADCIVVPYDHCCGATRRAINKAHQDAYDAHPEWQSYHEDDCALIGACQPDDDVTEATCEPSSGTCRLVFP